jgi:DNA-binding response OmpR family regulator
MPDRILIVNDDPALLRLVDLLLKEEGYEPIPMHNKVAAYGMAIEEPPSLIILDTWLDERDSGWELLLALQADGATVSIPVLICTSDLDGLEEKKGALSQMPGVQVISKPFNPDVLLVRIKQMLEPTLEGSA